jgi:phospholipid/cholesterol/gamma-HCH transport system substrate-binding protein
VQYSGIKVGDVSPCAWTPKTRAGAGAHRLSGDTPIKEDTQAKLALTGVTGNSIIQLSGGTPQARTQGQGRQAAGIAPRHRPSRACSMTAATW